MLPVANFNAGHNLFSVTHVAMQEYAAQHTCGTYSTYNTSSKHNFGKIAEMAHSDFIGEDSGKNLHYSDSENW